MYPKKLRQSIKRAQRLYQKFTWDCQDDSLVVELPLFWPDAGQQALLGQATAIGYYSDKAKAGHPIEYVHQHEEPLPRLMKAKVQGEVFSRLTKKQSIQAPNPAVFTYLARALDWEFQSKDGAILHLDWKDTDPLPLVLWNEQTRMLVVTPEDGGDVVVATSRILTVNERGIIF
jgi:hypothetical protein